MIFPRARRPIVGHPLPVRFELLELGLLDHAGLKAVRATAVHHGKAVTLNGAKPESTLEPDGAPQSYRVADGEAVASALPWLYHLYAKTIPELVRSHVGLEICPSRFRRSAITLNTITGAGNRYERHIDSNSITGLLFASTLDRQHGGALRMHYPDCDPIDLQPQQGVLLIYDARWVPHEVMPLLVDATRVSVPMNYFLPTDVETRPAHLDAYIFGRDV